MMGLMYDISHIEDMEGYYEMGGRRDQHRSSDYPVCVLSALVGLTLVDPQHRIAAAAAA